MATSRIRSGANDLTIEGRGPAARGTPRGVRLSTIWVAAALLLPPMVVSMALLSTGDLAYGIRAGRSLLETGSVLRVDGFTFSAWCRPWLNQQWAAQAVFAGIFDVLGWFGMALLRAGLATGTVALTFAACRAYGAERRQAAWLALLAWVPHIGGQLRASFFGLLLFAALLWLIGDRVEHPRRLWWAVPLVTIWANLHGSFPFAILVLLIAAIEDRVSGRSPRKTLVVTACCLLASLATPFGLGVWTYVVDLSTDPLIRSVIPEWQPPWTNGPVGAAFFASAALAVVVFVRSRRALRWPAWLQLAIFLVAAASSMRNLFWFSIVLSVTIARLPWARRTARVDPANRLNVVLIGVLAILPLAALLRWAPYMDTDPPTNLLRFAPERLTEELRSILRPGEPYANPQSWGSWLELTLPGNPVYVDARIEALPARAQLDSVAIAHADEGWQERLDALPVRVLVVDRLTEPDLVAALPDDAEWRQVYADDDGLILVRDGRSPPPALPPCPALD